MSKTSWSNDDAQSLREYISNHPKVMEELQSRMPRSTGVTNVEEAVCAGQRTEGFLMAMDKLKDMAEHKTKTETFTPRVPDMPSQL